MHAVRENATYITRNNIEVVLTSLDPRKELEAKYFDEGYRFKAVIDGLEVPFTNIGTTQLDNFISAHDLMEIITE